MVEIDELGTVHDKKSFDTHTSASAVTDMITYINSVTANRYVLTGVKGTASEELNKNSSGYTTLSSIGWDSNNYLNYGHAFSIIGKKGASSGDVI